MDPFPTSSAIKSEHPLTQKVSDFILKSRQTVHDILNGSDPRKLFIVGPCSIHELGSAIEFAKRLKKLSDKVSSQIFLVMRVYFEKPRTSLGWKGFLVDPCLNESYAVHSGIRWSRELLLTLADMQVPAATEFLDPLLSFYFDDLITWGSIGARTASSQVHRHLASHLSMPIGFKNGVAGNVSAAIDGVLAASHRHTFLHVNPEGVLELIQSRGNEGAHVVLRGGESGPNFDKASVSQLLSDLKKSKLPLRVLIDCAHHNSTKNNNEQSVVFQSVLNQILEGNEFIRGMMLESHLFEGNQPHPTQANGLKYGISITDPCLEWELTEHLVLSAAKQLQQVI